MLTSNEKILILRNRIAQLEVDQAELRQSIDLLRRDNEEFDFLASLNGRIRDREGSMYATNQERIESLEGELGGIEDELSAYRTALDAPAVLAVASSNSS